MFERFIGSALADPSLLKVNNTHLLTPLPQARADVARAPRR
jgi:hypothetical protein